MKNWFFRWWMRNMQKASEESTQEARVLHAAAAANHFDGGVTFQLIDAENGKILRVQIHDDGTNTANGPAVGSSSRKPRHIGGFGPGYEKLYVIPDGEDVMAFVTRALVEERIK